MELVYTGEDSPKKMVKSIFLAGPTPRSKNVQSWRPEALRILEEKKFAGTVFVPEFRGGAGSKIYNEHTGFAWETKGLNQSDCIVFWVPRNLKTLPGFTTNVEFGLWVRSGKCILGAPPKKKHIDYLKKHAGENKTPFLETLEEIIEKALLFVGDGVIREEGECNIPFFIWNTPSFQHWYAMQKHVGNRIDGAQVVWNSPIHPKTKISYFWLLRANVYVAAEKRNKFNEVVFGRPSISSVVLYKRENDIMKSKVILVREFRSPGASKDGYVHDLPGGSSVSIQDPIACAAEEVAEETGLQLTINRFSFHGARQLIAPLSVHKAEVFSAELTNEELEWFHTQEGVMRGLGGEQGSGE